MTANIAKSCRMWWVAWRQRRELSRYLKIRSRLALSMSEVSRVFGAGVRFVAEPNGEILAACRRCGAISSHSDNQLAHDEIVALYCSAIEAHKHEESSQCRPA